MLWLIKNTLALCLPESHIKQPSQAGRRISRQIIHREEARLSNLSIRAETIQARTRHRLAGEDGVHEPPVRVGCRGEHPLYIYFQACLFTDLSYETFLKPLARRQPSARQAPGVAPS